MLRGNGAGMVAEQARAARDAVRVSAAAAVGGFLFGYDTGVVNGSVPAVAADFGLGSGALGLVVAAALLGCAVGAWFAGPMSDRWGRTRVMLLAGVVFAVGSVGASLSLGPLTLAYWRVVQGLAMGAAIVMAAAYIAEVAPARLRGRLGLLMQVAIVAGIVVSLLVALVISAVAGAAAEGGAAWRWMFAGAAVPGAVFAWLAMRLPESPGGVVDRFVGLSQLRGPRFGLLPIVWTGLLLAALQQLVGINTVFYYSTAVWRAVGFGGGEALVTSLVTGLVNLGATVGAVFLVDRVGRRPLLLAGSAGMAATLLVLAVTFATGEGQRGADAVALIATNLYVVAFAMSWGPVLWVLLGELFASQIRASALAAATAVNWLANWVVSASFPRLSEAGLPVAYGVFAAFAVGSLLFVHRASGWVTGQPPPSRAAPGSRSPT